MAHDILARLRDSLLLRASVATIVAIVLLGVASGALPLTCMAHLAACPTNPAVEQGGVQAKAQPVVEKAQGKASPKTAAKTVPPVAKPTLTHNDVVAGTFAMLSVELSPPPEDSELKTRKVTTIAIGPDGQPVVPGVSPAAVQPLVVPAAQATVAPAVQKEAPVAEAVVEETPATVEPDEVDAPPVKSKPSAGTATIKGSGANVHASAGKKSDVLYALDPGENVTITEDSHGWLKVTDAEGRTGWVWEELLIRN